AVTVRSNVAASAMRSGARANAADPTIANTARYSAARAAPPTTRGCARGRVQTAIAVGCRDTFDRRTGALDKLSLIWRSSQSVGGATASVASPEVGMPAPSGELPRDRCLERHARGQRRAERRAARRGDRRGDRGDQRDDPERDRQYLLGLSQAG